MLVVPKLRTAAFLKARIRNTSSMTLPKGPAGLTLDGPFLGKHQPTPTAAPATYSVLNLDVDPSVNMTYSNPAVKRSQTDVFQKEGNRVYPHTGTITNTKSNRALEGIVLDQIPVMSKDERLRVEVLQLPSCLKDEGDVVKTGAEAAAAGTATQNWGKARVGRFVGISGSSRGGVRS